MVAQSKYLQTLYKDVMDNSDSNDWDSAVTEWENSDVEEDELLEESCICGKEHLRYLFTIENQLNGNVLYPIGSSCIKKFERDDLKYEVDVKEQLLRYLFEVGAFKATKWNNFEPEKDYEFMIDMFNKRNRTENQNKKAVAIILTSIKPFLQEELAHKVKK